MQMIAYKQRLEADESRRKAMDKHLVFLVKQTERYRCVRAPRISLEGDDHDRRVALRLLAGPASRKWWP